MKIENVFSEIIPVFRPNFRNKKRANGFRSLFKLELFTTKKVECPSKIFKIEKINARTKNIRYFTINRAPTGRWSPIIL